MRKQLIVKLLSLENTEYGKHFRFWYQRTGENTFVVSLVGYAPCSFDHERQADWQKELLDLGARYDFEAGVEKFDSMCGRTFYNFIYPKE